MNNVTQATLTSQAISVEHIKISSERSFAEVLKAARKAGLRVFYAMPAVLQLHGQ